MPSPPKLPLAFFRWFCHPELLLVIEGDLQELYAEARQTRGKFHADLRFTWDILLLFRRNILRPYNGRSNTGWSGLPNHYLKVAFRGLLKDKPYLLTAVGSLTIALIASLVICQYIRSAYSYDLFHQDVAHKYRIVQTSSRNDTFNFRTTLTPAGLGEEINASVAGLKSVVRIRPLLTDEGVVLSTPSSDRKFMEYGIWYVDSDFLQFFDFPIRSGNGEFALTEPNSIVLTEQSANKYFGDKDPVGETLVVHGGSISGQFKVTGVLTMPSNTHMKFDFLIPLDFLMTHYGLYLRDDGWGWTNFHTYLWTEKDANIAQLENEFDRILSNHWQTELSGNDEAVDIHLQPVSDIHLHTDFSNGMDANNNSERNIGFLSVIAIIILLTGYVNYINLATARATKRVKEAGIRKTIGARKTQLIGQFLYEALLTNMVAIILALIIGPIISPLIGRHLLGSDLVFTLLGEPIFWLAMLAVLLAAGLLTGLYPALLLTRMTPSGMLKPKANTRAPQGSIFRSAMIVFQLTISLLLVATTFLIHEQITFMKNQELGIAMDQIFVIHGPRVVLEEGQEQFSIKHQTLRNKLLENPHVKGITGSTNVPGTGEIWSGGMRKLGDPQSSQQDGSVILVGHEFTSVYGFEFLAGGPFTRSMKDYEAVIINEEAVKVFQLGTPQEALYHSIILSDLDTLKIQGVVANSHWNSLKEAHAPLFFGIVHDFNAFLSLHLEAQDMPQTLAYIEAVFRQTYPKDPYKTFFLDRYFNDQYQAESQFKDLFAVFTLIALGISCSGLFALLAYSLSLRTKEIGIRKVMGAQVSSLVALISREYLWMAVIACVVGLPVFLVGAQLWLADYAFRITLDWHLLAVPVFVVLLVLILSLSYRIYLATRLNPIHYLKDE